jgi:hypothetical protein
MIPVFERVKTVHALDRAATVIGCRIVLLLENKQYLGLRRNSQHRDRVEYVFVFYVCVLRRSSVEDNLYLYLDLLTVFIVCWGGVRLSPLGMSATNWPVVPAPDDR